MSKLSEWRIPAIALVVGLIAGPIISNLIGWQVSSGTMEEQMGAAVVEQQALFCEERARADPAYTDAAAFKALDFSAKREFVTPHAQMPGQGSADSAVVRACVNELGAG
ncbi:MAG: hypothetical protein E2O93_06475 [Alphaproteobacteria bacterium]|nr:MAG: hypothetical protein E2O93_06475 [Alphaproteobacteria bacterium]